MELSTNLFKIVTPEHTFYIFNWNCTFDIGLLYSENLSQAVYVAFDSENSFDNLNFEETFGTNFNTMPSFS
jgi:hypothetical protein